MKKREELIALRANALLAMESASKAEIFVQADYDKAKNTVDALTAQIQALDTRTKLENEVDDVLPFATAKKTIDSAKMTSVLAYVRTGVVDPQNAVTVGGASNGAVLIPESYATSILNELANNIPMRKFATVYRTSGTYNMPIGGSTPTFDWIAEGGSYPKPDLAFTNKTLDAFKAGGIILVAEELLNDESFDLETHLKEKIVEGISETEGVAFISGNGTGKPKGISLDIDVGLTETLDVLDTIAVTDVEDVYLAVPAKARKNGKWIISDKFYKAIFRMKDSTGNYIMREGQNGLPGTIFNRPFEIDDTMTGAAGEPLAIFGKLEDYVIGDRGEMAIQRLDQTYAEDGYVGFKVYKRTDGKLSRNKYVSKLMNAAS